MRRILPALLLLLLAQPAFASFAVCNRTAHATRVAIGLFNGTEWASRGWWDIAPHQCQTLITTPLVARYYYLYASDGGAGSWAGSNGFCVSSGERFEIIGKAGCARRGFDRKGFFAVDTQDKQDYTQSLSD